jgi:hypothetical protein
MIMIPCLAHYQRSRGCLRQSTSGSHVSLDMLVTAVHRQLSGSWYPTAQAQQVFLQLQP